jgi:hypothetical protein
MDNFDLKKYLVENKLTRNTESLSEDSDMLKEFPEQQQIEEAMKKSLQAQREFKSLLQTASVDDLKKFKKMYYETMKHEGLMYPGLMRNFGMHT